MDWSGVDYCDVFIRLSFWRHPFTAEHPLLRHWCRDTFLQIWWRNKLILILDGLHFWLNYSFMSDQTLLNVWSWTYLWRSECRASHGSYRRLWHTVQRDRSCEERSGMKTAADGWRSRPWREDRSSSRRETERRIEHSWTAADGTRRCTPGSLRRRDETICLRDGPAQPWHAAPPLLLWAKTARPQRCSPPAPLRHTPPEQRQRQCSATRAHKLWIVNVFHSSGCSAVDHIQEDSTQQSTMGQFY